MSKYISKRNGLFSAFFKRQISMSERGTEQTTGLEVCGHGVTHGCKLECASNKRSPKYNPAAEYGSREQVKHYFTALP